MRWLIPALLIVNSELGGQAATRFITARDGVRIAYDVSGSGPAVMLLHGGGQTRRIWHETGYVSRLAHDFTVITVDLRGNGESDKPTDAAAYGIDRFNADLLAVADAAGASRFALVGFSYGANIGRYLAATSDRISAMLYVGIPFGPAASGIFRETILQMRAKWMPVIDAHQRGALDVGALPAEDRAAWQRGNVPVTLAWLSALLDYPAIEPKDMKAPTLWMVGTANTGAMESVTAYRDALTGTRVSLELLPGLTHPQELEKIDEVWPKQLAFLRSHR